MCCLLFAPCVANFLSSRHTTELGNIIAMHVEQHVTGGSSALAVIFVRRFVYLVVIYQNIQRTW